MAKKVYSQNDLRRLMQEQRSKTTKGCKSTSVAERIESPLAKYENGQLTCILCQSIVRSESVWKVHINSKGHREKVAAAKELKEHLLKSAHATGHKRANPQGHNLGFIEPPIPEKKTKLENNNKSEKQKEEVPNDFFDKKPSYFTMTLNKTSIKQELVNIKRNVGDQIKMNVEEPIKESDKLPEGFFDDPIKDAKIRNTDYKDPKDEEWEKFQREIKEETVHSIEIIAGDQEEAIVERQIEELDEQIQNWSKVLKLEKLKENVIEKKNQMRQNEMHVEQIESDDEEIDLDNLLDWRAKKLKLK